MLDKLLPKYSPLEKKLVRIILPYEGVGIDLRECESQHINYNIINFEKYIDRLRRNLDAKSLRRKQREDALRRELMT